MRKGPKSPRKSGGSRPNSGRTGRELWLTSLQNTGGHTSRRDKGYIGKRTTVEYWTDTLRSSGTGISTESTGMDTMTGLRKSQAKSAPYGSTSHYLRQLVGTEKPKKNMQDPTARPASGRPAYKSPEEYYDEILALKKEIVALKNENSTMRSKTRRLEEDNLKKEREIEQLLDPSKNDEMRRTLADRKPDTGMVIHSLKQKILKLEHQMKDKEAAYAKLQSDLKTTKIDELKTQLDVFSQEIIRLNQLKSMGLETTRSPKVAPVKENASKVKALHDTIHRMNEKNVRLQTENKTLKQDLEKMMEQEEQKKLRQKDYDDMSKKQLLSAIDKLERRLDRAENDALSITSETDSRQTDIQGKITLEGSLQQKLDQLDKRETELLEEIQKQRSNIKKLKEDRAHYRKRADNKDKELKALKKEMEALQAELDSFYENDKSRVTPRPTPRVASGRKSPSQISGRRSPSVMSEKRSRSPTASDRELERERQRRVQEFVENRAARNIQKNWKSHHSRVVQQEEEKRKQKEHEKQVEEFKERRAAKRIQKGWLDYKGKKYDEEMTDAAEFLQSAMRGHLSRQVQMQNLRKRDHRHRDDRRDRRHRDEEYTASEVTESDYDSPSEVLQAALKGHMMRKEIRNRRSSSRSGHGGRYYNKSKADSLEEDETDSVNTSHSRQPSSSKSRPFSGKSSASSFSKSKFSPPVSSKSPRRRMMEDEEDDDDIVVSSRGQRGRIF